MDRLLHYRRSLCAASLIGISLTLGGCGALVAWDAGRDYDPPPYRNQERARVYGRDSEAVPDAAWRFATMALLSHAAYRTDLAPDQRWGSACRYLEPGDAVPTAGMPVSEEGGWRRWAGSPRACMDEHGLAYETYIYERKAGASVMAETAVIAFRGTENEGGQLLRDWGSNFAAAVGTEPPEYRRAQEAVKPLVAEITAAFPGIRIHATGHSLGGGLAQQAGYLSRRIEAVYAFNTSPVTNWSHMTIKDRFARQEGAGLLIEQQNPTVFRIFHSREGLSYVRQAAARFQGTEMNRKDYEFFFQDGTAVQSHSMALLACYLMHRYRGPTDAFGLSKEYVRAVTSGKPPGPYHTPVCEDYPEAGKAVGGDAPSGHAMNTASAP